MVDANVWKENCEEKFGTSGVFAWRSSSVGLANLDGSTSRDESEQTFMVFVR